MIEVEVRDAGGWIEIWGAWQPAHIVQEPLRSGMRRVGRRLATYPAKRPGQTYERTERLRDAWMGAAVIVQGMNARMGVQTRYARYVQGDGTQAWMHKGRWQTDKQALAAETPRITKDIDAAIERSLNNV